VKEFASRVPYFPRDSRGCALQHWKSDSQASLGFGSVVDEKPQTGLHDSKFMCSCHLETPPKSTVALEREHRRYPVRSAAALGVSFLVAFFPKCPMCWAAYSSGFGATTIFQTQYIGYLFPVLVGMLGVHLLLVFKQSASVGYGPVLVSVCGTLTLLLGRHFVPQAHWVLNCGILLILGGSAWSSFRISQRHTGQQFVSMAHRTDCQTHATKTAKPNPDASFLRT
jgi:hypothetical protein